MRARDEWWRVAPQLHVLGLLTAIDVMVRLLVES